MLAYSWSGRIIVLKARKLVVMVARYRFCLKKPNHFSEPLIMLSTCRFRAYVFEHKAAMHCLIIHKSEPFSILCQHLSACSNITYEWYRKVLYKQLKSAVHALSAFIKTIRMLFLLLFYFSYFPNIYINQPKSATLAPASNWRERNDPQPKRNRKRNFALQRRRPNFRTASL